MDQEGVEDGEYLQPSPSKINKICQKDHEEFDDKKNPFPQQIVVLKTETGHIARSLGFVDADDDLSNNVDNDCFQPKPTKLDRIEEFDDKNPFQVFVILDILFKMLSFEELKKFRLISSTWNEVGLKEISKRHQKPIKFNEIEDLGEDEILGQLVQLQKSHQNLFGGDHQLFYNFSFNITLLSSPQIDQFFDHFSTTKFVKFYGHPIMKEIELPNGTYREEEVKEEIDPQILQFLSKFLIKISPTVQVLQYDDLYLYFDNKQSLESATYEELATTKFQNLRKLIINMNCHNNSNLKKMFIYPIIGQNSPKLVHLKCGSFYKNGIGLGSLEEVKELLEPTGLIQKLQNLELINADKDLLNGFTEFAQNGMLKLSELSVIFTNNNINLDWANEIILRLITTHQQALKILKISTPYSYAYIRVPFPQLQNLTFLQIDNFSNFETFYHPINFSVQFPKLEEFRTNQIKTFLHKNLGRGGDSIKYCTFYNKKLTHLENCRADHNSHRIDFVKFGQIFPNLEFLELSADDLPLNGSPEVENLPFWSQLRKVVIHCRFNNDLANFNMPILKAIKKLEILVNCEDINMMNEDFYKDYLGFIIMGGYDDNSGYYNREKFYKKYLTTVSNSLKSIHTASYTITGYKISEDFKRDFREIFPGTNFICSPFKSPEYDY